MRELEPPGLRGELRGVGVGSDGRGLEPALAGHDDRCRTARRRRPPSRPDRTRRSAATRRSPARRDSCTTPSAGTWSPVRSSSRSSATTSADRDLGDRPSRTTRARGALSTASRSRVRLARTSWTMPMAEFATMTRPNKPFCQRPVSRMHTKSAVSSPLKTGEHVGPDDLADRAAGAHLDRVRPARPRPARRPAPRSARRGAFGRQATSEPARQRRRLSCELPSPLRPRLAPGGVRSSSPLLSRVTGRTAVSN